MVLAVVLNTLCVVRRTSADSPLTGYVVDKIAESYARNLSQQSRYDGTPDPGTLQDAARHAEAVADHGIDTSNARALAKIRNALIRQENVAKEARKQVIEPALDDEIDVGDRVAGVGNPIR